MLSDALPLNQIQRVLVTKLRHHGDVLLASPVFQVLANHGPHLEIDALVYEDTRDMLDGHPAIRAIFTIDREWKRKGPVTQLQYESALFNRLRERRYHLLVHLTEHPRGAWLAQLLRPRWSVAPRRDNWLWTKSFSHTYPLPMHTPRHTVETNLDALRRLGVQPGAGERRLVMAPGAEAQAKVDAVLASRGLADAAFIQVHPTSRWLFKAWSDERNAELLRALHRDGHRVVITAAPSTREKAIVARILELAPGAAIDLSGQFSLRELAALTHRAKLFIGVDSAPMHIAAAMQTPVVALFGPSGEHQWRPWEVAHRVVVSEDHPCRPCGNDGCGGGKVSECLTTLPVARVLSAANELLAGQRAVPIAFASGA
jgi:heptosyltransferase III